MREAETSLGKAGEYPKMPTLNGTKKEWDEFGNALEELRRQGKLPPVPKSLQKK